MKWKKPGNVLGAIISLYVLTKKKMIDIRGRVVVRAGAGTGKTKSLIDCYEKALDMVIKNYGERGVEKVLALTFSRMATKEIRERVLRRFKEKGTLTDTIRYNLSIFTIDSFCSRILRENAIEIGLKPDFKILDEAESKVLFYKVSQDLLKSEVKIPDFETTNTIDEILSNAYTAIVRLRQRGVGYDDMELESEKDKFLYYLYYNYENSLKKENAFDFSSLLLFTYKILKDRRDILFNLQEKYDYIFVDEYQDTSI
ncbi:MAG: hypothetical protein DRI36_06110, partial [Caldiserica bacterium]